MYGERWLKFTKVLNNLHCTKKKKLILLIIIMLIIDI